MLRDRSIQQEKEEESEKKARLRAPPLRRISFRQKKAFQVRYLAIAHFEFCSVVFYIQITKRVLAFLLKGTSLRLLNAIFVVKRKKLVVAASKP